MTVWAQTSEQVRLAWLLALFCTLCVQLFGLTVSFEHRRGRHWRGTALWSALLLAFLLVLYDFPQRIGLPLWSVGGAVLLSAAAAAVSLYFGIRHDRRRITRASIKEAMDDLPMASCYFAPRGTVKLCSRRMAGLYRAMTGRDLQTLTELRAALTDCVDRGIGRTRDGGYVFPDGSVWYYQERETLADGVRYTEAIFTDGTELFAANDELERDDRELLRVNEKLQKMYARAEDRVREREYLAFKMKIHDDIGQSLSVLRQTLQSGASQEKTERQVKKLSLAAETLVYSPGAGSGDPYDALLAEVAELGVEIKLDGMLPIEPDIYDLVVQAIRECLTNCVRHAHGAAVSVRITGIPGGYTVRITNDGERPRGPIREGGGLSALRQSIENAGGDAPPSRFPVSREVHHETALFPSGTFADGCRTDPVSYRLRKTGCRAGDAHPLARLRRRGGLSAERVHRRVQRHRRAGTEYPRAGGQRQQYQHHPRKRSGLGLRKPLNKRGRSRCSNSSDTSSPSSG